MTANMLSTALHLLPPVVAHAGATTPVPHWVVLLVGVAGLWVVIGGGVVVMDRLLARFSER
jgi:hypothetical protein